MKLPERYSNIKIDTYIIMPNHVHMIVSIPSDGQEWQQENNQEQEQRQEQSPCPTNIKNPTIGDIICTLKSLTTKQSNKEDNMPGRKIWQARFHDRIIRNDAEYQKIWQYIDANPTLWAEDCYYSKSI